MFAVFFGNILDFGSEKRSWVDYRGIFFVFRGGVVWLDGRIVWIAWKRARSFSGVFFKEFVEFI